MDEGSSAGLVGRELAQAPLYQRLRAIEYSREVVLVISFVLLIVLFAVTAVVSRLYHDKVQSLANDWFSKGEAAFRSGNVTAALTDYRNALVYSPNNSVFQLHLAQALAAAGHLDEAESYFMNLLAESPGNGEINLELARIAVRKKQSVDPMRYYQSAIYGVWDTDPLTMRWNVRRELCEYLLGAGDLSHAQPEIIALAQEVPAGDLERQKLAGAFLLRGELWDRALAEFTSVLKFDPRDEEALAGAGQAAFDLGHYSDALGYFDRLSLEKKTDPHLAGMIEQARAIVFADPWAGGLSPGKAHGEYRELCARRSHESRSALTKSDNRSPRRLRNPGFKTSMPRASGWRASGVNSISRGIPIESMLPCLWFFKWKTRRPSNAESRKAALTEPCASSSTAAKEPVHERSSITHARDATSPACSHSRAGRWHSGLIAPLDQADLCDQ